MKKNVMKIFKYSLFLIIPLISVFLCVTQKIAQGERNEEIVVGIMLGIVFDIIYFIVLLYMNKEPNNIPNNNPVPPMPCWEDIISLMYDKGLDSFCGEVIRVFYSKDKTMRYVILRDEKGIFTYQLEAIYQFDEDEYKYTYVDENTLPAMWETVASQCGGALFANEEDLMHDLKSQHEYKQYFN